ncbi:hypothetical protein KN815_47810, partial [Streptomyces sp. 4503]|nr:hypothetical protein [Streptomyces niphimycinicus]
EALRTWAEAAAAARTCGDTGLHADLADHAADAMDRLGGDPAVARSLRRAARKAATAGAQDTGPSPRSGDGNPADLRNQ